MHWNIIISARFDGIVGCDDAIILDVNRARLNVLGDGAQLLKIVGEATDSSAVRTAGSIDRVTNAAMPLGLFIDRRVEAIGKIMTINYGGVVSVTNAAVPRMLARRSNGGSR